MLSRPITLILSFLAANLISVITGTQYLFSVYGPALAQQLNFSSVQINMIGSALNNGKFLSNPFFGHIVDRYGSRRATLFTSVVLFSSFSCLAFTYKGSLPPSSILCAFYLFMTGVGSSAGFMSVLTSQAKNFPNFRGIALATPLAFFGLSAFIYSQIETFFFYGDTFKFILFLAISTGSCAFIGTWFLHVAPSPARSSISEQNEDQIRASSTLGSSNDNERTPLISKDKKTQSDGNLDIGGWDLFTNRDAQVFSFIMFFLGGAGLMYINNVGSMVQLLFKATSHSNNDPSNLDETRQKLQSLQNLHVSLISIFSCIGRIAAGFISDITKNAFQMRRLWYLMFASIFIFTGQLIVSYFVVDLNRLWISSALIGFGYGNIFSIGPTIISEWFGLRRFGLNWGLISCSTAIGGQILSILYGFNRDSQKNTCHGANCYNQVFWVTSAGCFMCTLLLTNLLWTHK
ncbi:hypothetical protein G9A89_001307 [Geosiphon pyriformis]|nr:hypothetical protein G9A89_001307 [Geosiphon pyriformis]